MRNDDVEGPADGRRFAFARRMERGVYAVEFAIVFPVFFLLFYGILTFGLIFTAQQSLTLAAEDGARATLRYQRVAGAAGSSVLMEQLRERVALACQVANERAAWLGTLGAAPNCVGEVRGACANPDGTIAGGSCAARFTAGTAATAVFCGYQAGQQCAATVSVTYGYARHPLVPPMPGIGFLLPQTLRGVATVTLDPALLQRMGTGA